jgi:phosphoribosyl 1,2-cyclic phosphodiesterase
MKITYWGVRGLIPTPGSNYIKYGGNTVCVGIEDEQKNILALDAGTGLTVFGRNLLSTSLGKGKGVFNMLITNSHYDHIQGFPFFIPAFIPKNTINIYGSELLARTLEDVLEGQMNPNFSPIQTLKNLSSNLVFKQLKEIENTTIGSLNIDVVKLPRENGCTLGVKVFSEKNMIIYAPNVIYSENKIDQSIVEIYKDADLLIHNSALEENHYYLWEQAVRYAGLANVKRISFINHHPNLKDKDLEQFLEVLKIFALNEGYKDLQISVAQEGYSIMI